METDALGAKVIHERIRGYGRSYKRGFATASGDLIVTLDGDHSYPVDAISYLIETFLQMPETAFIHVRSASRGCYTMGIERQ